MNVEYPDSKTPIENIFWKPNTALNGSYNVYLKYYNQHEPNINETPYSIEIKYGGIVERYSGKIKKENNSIHIASFMITEQTNQTPQGEENSIDLQPDNSLRNNLEKERNRLQKELDRVNIELEKIENSR